MALMTNSYVRRDANTEIGFLPPTSSESMMMNDGTTMPATAFREDSPVMKYTPEELGMNPRASPFYDPDTNSAAMARPAQPSGSQTTAVDSNSAASTVLDAEYTVEAMDAVGTGAVMAAPNFNTWFSSNIGFIALACVGVYAVYRFGVNSNAA